MLSMTYIVFTFMTVLSLCRGFHWCGPRTHGLQIDIGQHFTRRKISISSTRSGEFWEANMDCWRPTVDDVERISWGKPAKKKGTGSRGVPHRLNEEERDLFAQARRKGFLEINASGWRKERRDAPLLNTYRSLCDARGQPSIVLHKSSNGMDHLVADISPLRVATKFAQIAEICSSKYTGGEIIYQGSLSMEVNGKDNQNYACEDEPGDVVEDAILCSFEIRPIYQLPPYFIAWELNRPDAKALAKILAEDFQTREQGKISRKPVFVKPGKGRRHGGYGIG
jgi:hypothetical protein